MPFEQIKSNHGLSKAGMKPGMDVSPKNTAHIYFHFLMQRFGSLLVVVVVAIYLQSLSRFVRSTDFCYL